MYYSQQLLTSYLIKHLFQWLKCRILSYWPWVVPRVVIQMLWDAVFLPFAVFYSCCFMTDFWASLTITLRYQFRNYTEEHCIPKHLNYRPLRLYFSNSVEVLVLVIMHLHVMIFFLALSMSPGHNIFTNGWHWLWIHCWH